MKKLTMSQAGALGYQKSKVALGKIRECKIQESISRWNHKKCEFCNKEIPYEKRNNKFCNRSCAASYNNSRYPKRKKEKNYNICEFCKSNLHNRSKRFCNNKCQANLRRQISISEWLNNQGDFHRINAPIRRYIFEKYNFKCCECSWSVVNFYTGKLPLEIDHIDGNHTNNREENLRLLCPNCHSLTSTYKGANKGNGRKYRKRYYANKTS